MANSVHLLGWERISFLCLFVDVSTGSYGVMNGEADCTFHQGQEYFPPPACPLILIISNNTCIGGVAAWEVN